MYWNHRTIRHVNSKFPPEEPTLTVHEVYYDKDNLPNLWSPNERSPTSKEDCDNMRAAFDKEPVIEVDDASIESIAEGFGVNYKTWKWLVEHSPVAEELEGSNDQA